MTRRMRRLTAACAVIIIAAAAIFTSSLFASQGNTSTGSTTTISLQSDGYPEDLNFWSDYPADELATALVNRMTDTELLAQTYMLCWPGQEPSAQLTTWIDERAAGSIKVFGWNSDNLEILADAIKYYQERAQATRFKIPLFVATDQEGGWIRHVKGETSDTPGNLAIGAGALPVDAYYTGYYIGREMAALGINMNFAPTLDLYTQIESSVIGPRSFGEDPETAGILGASFMQGSLDAGVIATAKHFPGHGDTSDDSHGKLPVIHIDEQTLNEREIVPFKTVIEAGIPAIMSGHLNFPQITGNGEPASLSKYFLTDILRNEMGFEGLIITDDMTMIGATSWAGTLSSAVQMSLRAGNDIVLFAEPVPPNDAAWTKNFRLMQEDEEFHDIVKEAACRVIRTKLDYFKSGNAAALYPDSSTLSEKIPDPDGVEFYTQQALRSISVTKADLFPYTTEMASQEKVLICGQFIKYGDEFYKRYPDADFYSYKYSMTAGQLAEYKQTLPATARKYDTIIFCVANEESEALARTLRDCGKKVIIISILSPKFTLSLDFAETILYAYSYSDYSFKAAAAVLAGEIPALGVLPVTIED